MDNQQREIVGRLRLTEALICAGLDVAHPVRDRGVDLIAYVDGDSSFDTFLAVPIQMKAATKEGFSVDRGYEKMEGLLLVYAWYIFIPERTCFFAMSYPESLTIAGLNVSGGEEVVIFWRIQNRHGDKGGRRRWFSPSPTGSHQVVAGSSGRRSFMR